MLAPYYPPAFSGAGLQAQRLGAMLAERGVTITVLTPAPPGKRIPSTSVETSLRVVRFPVPARGRRRDLALGAQAAIWLATHSDWDLLHMHAFSYFSLFPSWLAGVRQRPRLAKTTLMGFDDLATKSRGPGGPLLGGSYRRCEAVVAISRALADDFRSDAGFRGRVFEIPNGVDIDLFHCAEPRERAALRARFELPPEHLLVVSAGMLDRRKNLMALVKAVAALAPRRICLALAGPDEDPAYRREIETALRTLAAPLEGRLLGALPVDDIPDLLRAADLFALPSRREGLPNSLLEALACGVPCVASDIPGSRDALAFGGGVLVPLEDREAWTTALARLADDPEGRLRLAREARRAAENHFALPRIADAYLELYRTLLQ